MISLSEKIPSWILRHLPVKIARQHAKYGVSTTEKLSTGEKRQLLIDVSVIYKNDARTGIQRVVRALLLQLLKNPPVGYRICPIFSTRKHGYRYGHPNFLTDSISISDAKGQSVEVKSGDIFLGLDLCAHLLPRHQAQILNWKRSGVQVHVLVYDLLPVMHPEWFNSKTTYNFKHWIRWISIYADNAICISETVRVEFCTWLNACFKLPSNAIRSSSIVLGADIAASAPTGGLPNDSEEFLTKLQEMPSILMVGTLEPRKGYDHALAAFEELWQNSNTGPLLVIVGRGGWKTEALQKRLKNHPEKGKRLFWLDTVSDEYLAQLYARCDGVFVASYAEGFGLPLVEATLHRKPVFARNLSVFREMSLKNVSYFDSETAKGTADALSQWLAGPAFQQVLSAPPSQWESCPTWEISANQLLHRLGLKQDFTPSLALPSDIKIN